MSLRSRRLIAVLACRAEGSRLYGKPLQNLDPAKGVTILDQIISTCKAQPLISSIVLAVSQGRSNDVFHEVARRHKIASITGDPIDVLGRLIQGCRAGGGTDVFRVTTESPFIYYEAVKNAWKSHVQNENDVTTFNGLPEGSHFEIYKLGALIKSHKKGNEKHRSEFCSLFIRENKNLFKIQIIPIKKILKRPRLRLTVDYPEDLSLCREIYKRFIKQAPTIKLESIIKYLDKKPKLRNIVSKYSKPENLWS